MRKITVYDQVALIALAGESMVCYICLHNVVQLDVIASLLGLVFNSSVLYCPFSIATVSDEPLLAQSPPRRLLYQKKPIVTLHMMMTATLLYIKKGKKEK